jgi:hypothetical protein
LQSELSLNLVQTGADVPAEFAGHLMFEMQKRAQDSLFVSRLLSIHRVFPVYDCVDSLSQGPNAVWPHLIPLIRGLLDG